MQRLSFMGHHCTPSGVFQPIEYSAPSSSRCSAPGLLQQSGDGALAAAYRAVQEQHAFLDPIALGRAFECVHQAPEGIVQAKDRVAAMIVWIAKEAVAHSLLTNSS